VLIDSFEQEPLPNFAQRQTLSQRLGMTPRSVQIWFQNRRQRLKPSAQKRDSAGQPLVGRSGSLPDPSQYRPGASDRRSCELGQQPSPFLHGAAGQGRYGMAVPAPGISPSDDMFYRYRLPPMTQHAASAGSSFGIAPTLDVMDKFAATKALLGAGERQPLPPRAVAGATLAVESPPF